MPRTLAGGHRRASDEASSPRSARALHRSAGLEPGFRSPEDCCWAEGPRGVGEPARPTRATPGFLGWGCGAGAGSKEQPRPPRRNPVSHNPQLCGGGSEPGLWHHDGRTQECQHWDGMAATCCSHPAAWARPGQALRPSLLRAEGAGRERRAYLAQHPPCLGPSAASAAAGRRGPGPWPPPPP